MSGVKVFDVEENLADHVRNGGHFTLAHPARGDRGRAEPDATRLEGRARLKRNGVLVDGDTRFVERDLTVLSGHVLGTDIDQHEVVVRPAADEPEPVALKTGGKCARVEHDLV